jgi:cytochrome c-type biogenesis protein CcmE
MNRRIVKVLVTIAVFVGGAGMLLYSSLGDAEYYRYVDELMEDPEPWEGRNLRVNGFVEPGSIVEEVVDQRLERTFVIEREGRRIKVKHVGPAPDTFRDLSEVVAMGQLARDGDGNYVLEATEIMAKCPSKYEGDRRPSELGGAAPEPNLGSLPMGGESDAGSY